MLNHTQQKIYSYLYRWLMFPSSIEAHNHSSGKKETMKDIYERNHFCSISQTRITIHVIKIGFQEFYGLFCGTT